MEICCKKCSTCKQSQTQAGDGKIYFKGYIALFEGDKVVYFVVEMDKLSTEEEITQRIEDEAKSHLDWGFEEITKEEYNIFDKNARYINM